MKHKRDDSNEKQDEETVDVTPIMISVFVVMCCTMLLLLYYFYDYLGTHAPYATPMLQLYCVSTWLYEATCIVCRMLASLSSTNAALQLIHVFSPHGFLLAIWVIAIFCIASSVGLYSCLWPFVRRMPCCNCR